MRRWIEGTVTILRCSEKRHLTPHLTFTGDTDMVTLGLASLSSVVADEIVVADMNGAELADGQEDALERRINDLLGRDDLRFLRLRRVVAARAPSGTSFLKFRRTYEPPQLVFACPHCESDAVAVRAETPSEYQRSGGTVTIVPDLDLRD